jgi:hypothetical protein
VQIHAAAKDIKTARQNQGPRTAFPHFKRVKDLLQSSYHRDVNLISSVGSIQRDESHTPINLDRYVIHTSLATNELTTTLPSEFAPAALELDCAKSNNVPVDRFDEKLGVIIIGPSIEVRAFARRRADLL